MFLWKTTKNIIFQATFTCSKLTIKSLEQGVKCLKLTVKAPERGHWRRFVAFIVIFEHTSHHVLVFFLLTLKMQLPAEF